MGKQRVEMARLARRIRQEIDDKVAEGVSTLDKSHHEAVEDLNHLHREKEENEKRMGALREVSSKLGSGGRLRFFSNSKVFIFYLFYEVLCT